MSGQIPPTIDPFTTSGIDLSTLLNDFYDCYAKSFKGTTRPTNLQAGGQWLDDTNDPIWDLKMYNGTTDIVILSVNTTDSTVSIPGTDNIFTILRNTDDTIGAKLVLQKQRPTGDQVLSGDVVGDVDFNSRDDQPVNFLAGQVRAEATENHTATLQGTKISLRGTDTGSAALKTYATLIDSKMGVGTAAPTKTIEAFASDDRASLKVTRSQDTANPASVEVSKQRVGGAGQVLASDDISDYNANSHDGSAEFNCFKIRTTATETHTAGNRGVRTSIQSIETGTNTLVEVGYVDGKGINSDSSSTDDLLDKAATRVLETIDGAVYGSANIEVNFYGKDTSNNVLIQSSLIKCIYDIQNDQWVTFVQDDIDSTKLIKFNFTGTTVLQVEYLNQIADVNFDSGKIYKKVRRNIR